MAQTLAGEWPRGGVDDPDTPLLYVLRDNIGLRGPRARVYRLLHFGLARTGERSHRSGR